MKRGVSFYQIECSLFYLINCHYNRKNWNAFFHICTHLGGARFTIAITFGFLFYSIYSSTVLGLEMATALAISHIPVALIKKGFPRRRPYLVLQQSNVTLNPLIDHSFPSGHTTAFFSIIIPIIFQIPIIAIVLFPIAIMVGISRIFLGLHYPSDVLVGGMLGSLVGFLSVLFI